MGLNRNVGLASALRYKGQGPMLTYVLHRLGGLGMAIFITIHILSSFVGGKVGVFTNSIYENWIFQIFIFFSFLFHSINGLRIVILDLWPQLIEHQRQAVWLEWAIFLPLFAVAVYVLAISGLGG